MLGVPEALDEILHQALSRMDRLGLPYGRPLHSPVDALETLLMPDALGVRGAERSDHETTA